MGPPLLSRPPGHEKNQLVVHRYSDAFGCVFYDVSSSFAGIDPFNIFSQLKKNKNKKKTTFHASVMKMLPTNVSSAVFTPTGLMSSYYTLQLVPPLESVWNSLYHHC